MFILSLKKSLENSNKINTADFIPLGSVYPVLCILYPVFCVLYYVFCILYPVSCITYLVFCILYSLSYIALACILISYKLSLLFYQFYILPSPVFKQLCMFTLGSSYILSLLLFYQFYILPSPMFKQLMYVYSRFSELTRVRSRAYIYINIFN